MDKLQTLLKGHLAQLKAQGANANTQLSLVLFMPDAGINALMQKANLKEQRTIIDQTTEINTWFNHKISFHSVPSSLHETKALANYTKAILKAYQKKRLDSITVCLDIYQSSLMSPRGLIVELTKLKKLIASLCEPLKHQPNLIITFTQLDKIAGFCHTFAHETLNSAWGYRFTPYINEASLIRQQNENFNRLIEDLHALLLNKLHHTEDKLSRYLIREFPLQMESLSNMVRACIKHLTQKATVTQGVYFTSAKQGNHANDRLSKFITEAFTLSPVDKIPQSSLDKAFFIDGWINALSQPSPNIRLVPNSRLKLYGVSAAISLSLSVMLMGIYVQHQTSLLNKAHHQLLSSKQSFKTNDNAMDALEALKYAEEYAEQAENILSFGKVKDFTKNTKAQYLSGITHWLLPDFKHQIEEKLTHKSNPATTYQALKAYLMLENSLVMDKSYLLYWFENNWQPKLSKQEGLKIKALLSDAFKTPYPGIHINQDLVNNTRQYLLAMPKGYLLFALSADKLSHNNEKLNIANFFTQAPLIPDIYLKKNFISIFDQQLPKIAKTFIHDDFVLGFKEKNNIIETLQTQYTQNYIHFWKTFLSKAKAKSFNNYTDGQRFYLSLSKKDNAFEKLTEFVSQQLSPFANSQNHYEKVFNDKIASAFSGLDLISPYQFHLIRKEFASLAKYFSNFANANDGGKTAFSFAKQRFTHRNGSDPFSRLYELASELPPSVNSWLTGINDNGWFLVLLNTESYINTIWNQRVYQRYHLQLKDKFPFAPNSETQVSLSDFNDFFGANGTLSEFFAENLSPFIDMSSAKWQMKTLNHMRLPISENSLEEIMRANVIKEIFFPGNAREPEVNFSLHALSLEPIIRSLELDINEQSLRESQQQKISMDFHWPNTKGMAKTKLILTKVSGEQVRLEEDGDWGFFKLLALSNLSPIEDDTQNYQLVFDINGNSAKFLLSAKSPLNPFVPQLLESFKLPHRLS